MGKKPKKVDPVEAPKPIAPVTPEDEDIKKTGELERRRLAAQQGRTQTVTSQRSSILG
jgi:hypothetical protein